METSPPTLHDLYALGTVEGIAFWCSNHACERHDNAPVGVLAIDYGPGMTLPNRERFSDCVSWYGQVKVRPAWKAMSRSLIGRKNGSEGQT